MDQLGILEMNPDGKAEMAMALFTFNVAQMNAKLNQDLPGEHSKHFHSVNRKAMIRGIQKNKVKDYPTQKKSEKEKELSIAKHEILLSIIFISIYKISNYLYNLNFVWCKFSHFL